MAITIDGHNYWWPSLLITATVDGRHYLRPSVLMVSPSMAVTIDDRHCWWPSLLMAVTINDRKCWWPLMVNFKLLPTKCLAPGERQILVILTTVIIINIVIAIEIIQKIQSVYCYKWVSMAMTSVIWAFSSIERHSIKFCSFKINHILLFVLYS